MYKNIVVPYDGSAGAKRAFSVGLEMAKLYHGELYVIAVVSADMYSVYLPELSITYAEKMIMDSENSYANEMKKLREAAEKEGITMKSKVVEGYPVDKIIEYAEEVNADLIIMGSRGLSTAARLFLGSVSDAVVHHSKIDVLIVKK